MATITTHKCDLCGGGNPNLKQRIPVVFTTEQTEGRPCKPHLTTETLDVCNACMDRIVESYPLTASGAQGCNTYKWR